MNSCSVTDTTRPRLLAWAEMTSQTSGQDSVGRTILRIGPSRQHGSAQRCSTRVFLPATPPSRNQAGSLFYNERRSRPGACRSRPFFFSGDNLRDGRQFPQRGDEMLAVTCRALAASGSTLVTVVSDGPAYNTRRSEPRSLAQTGRQFTGVLARCPLAPPAVCDALHCVPAPGPGGLRVLRLATPPRKSAAYAAKAALDNNDIGAMYDCLTVETQDVLAGSIVHACQCVKMFGRGMAAMQGAKAAASIEKTLGEPNSVLEKHGVD